jgi:predicted membrane chloride channel (bestrophin family)
LVILGGAVIIMAMLGNVLKDYRSMSRDAKNKVAQKERDENYVRKLKEIVDQKNEALQKELKKQKKA